MQIWNVISTAFSIFDRGPWSEGKPVVWHRRVRIESAADAEPLENLEKILRKYKKVFGMFGWPSSGVGINETLTEKYFR